MKKAASPGRLARLKSTVRALIRRTGYELVRSERPDPRYGRASHDATRAQPAGAAETLRADNPRLAQLRQAYAGLELPMARPSMWGGDYLQRELDLLHFRGDNPYVWQFRNVGAAAQIKYYFYMRELAARDRHGLLNRLHEDGAFGCWTFEYPGWPQVSRDLLDSINELYFLDRHTGILERRGMRVLDIGAGYGRLAHRALAAAPGLERWLCVDAVPESTFLCEYYLGLRGCLDRAQVVPLHELDAGLRGQRVDLALNIHSFSEMPRRAIDGWLARAVQLGAQWLLIVPNDADKLLSMEDEGVRRPFDDLPGAHGFELAVKEPTFPDPTLRAFMGVTDHFFLYRRAP
ncbi:MAG TPA: putative sugar O-methyltransferase [Solimonas sp.]|nr:putative sugar O-methyltransferase [Solimonas sp.]